MLYFYGNKIIARLWLRALSDTKLRFATVIIVYKKNVYSNVSLPRYVGVGLAGHTDYSWFIALWAVLVESKLVLNAEGYGALQGKNWNLPQKVCSLCTLKYRGGSFGQICPHMGTKSLFTHTFPPSLLLYLFPLSFSHVSPYQPWHLNN